MSSPRGPVRRERNPALTALETTVDAEYRSLFNDEIGWERCMFAALLVYEQFAHGQDVQFADSLKYGAMHYARWGKNAPSRPLSGFPMSVSDGTLQPTVDALTHAQQYIGVWFAFIAAHSGICEVRRLDDRVLSLAANPRWFAYDALDLQIHDEQRAEFDLEAGARILRPILEPLLARGGTGARRTLTAYRLPVTPGDTQEFERIVYAKTHFLPDNWCLHEVPIAAFRLFWAGLAIMSAAHGAVGGGREDEPRGGTNAVMAGTRREWQVRLGSITGLPPEVVERLLHLHTLCPDKMADPALTPLLPIGGGWIVASPTMLSTAGFERNFCAFVARSPQLRKSYADASAYFSRNLTEDVSAAFEARGHKTASGVSIHSVLGSSGIDLLVWDAPRRHLLAIELKAMIKPADFMEVLNRGEETCRASLVTQLPKYDAAVREGGPALLRQAFRIESVEPSRIDCLLVVRGFVGTARLESERFPVLNDLLLVTWLREGLSLQEIVEAAVSRSYLPREGRDYAIVPRTIVTPSGFKIETHGWEPITVEGSKVPGRLSLRGSQNRTIGKVRA